MTMDRKLGSRAAAWLGIAALVAAAAVVAVASQLYVHGRADLTRDREFTLSRAAIRTLENLPDLVTVRVVMSRDLPAQFQQLRTRVVDLLREFEARSDGKLALVFEDPGQDEERRDAAVALGVQEVQLQEQSRDGMQVRRGFFGAALLYGEKKEVFPVIRDLETLEYELIVRLMRLTGGTKVIGVVEGAGGDRFAFDLPGSGQGPRVGFSQNFATLKANIEELYRVVPQNPAWAPIDTTVDLLLVAAPAYLSEEAKYRIDQYAMSGRPVLFLTPGMNVEVASGITAAPANNGYEDLLAHYGIVPRKNMVLEPRNWEMVRFGDALFPVPYPYWPVVTYHTMNAENPVTAGLQSVSLPWTSSFDVDTAAQPGAVSEPLLSSTRQAWEESGPLFLLPRELDEYRAGDPRTHVFALLRSGPMTSRYSVAPEGIPAAEWEAGRRASAGDARILAVANALFVTDFYIGYTGAVGNFHFLLNALDYLVLDPDLIRVRSRVLRDAPLDEERKAQARTTIILVNMLLVPSVLVLLGVWAGVRRRKREASPA